MNFFQFTLYLYKHFEHQINILKNNNFQISDTAVDKLALRAEAISVAQHFSRLYAPVVLVHQVIYF